MSWTKSITTRFDTAKPCESITNLFSITCEENSGTQKPLNNPVIHRTPQKFTATLNPTNTLATQCQQLVKLSNWLKQTKYVNNMDCVILDRKVKISYTV